MAQKGNVIYFCKVYVMDRVQTADKAGYLCPWDERNIFNCKFTSREFLSIHKENK